MGSQFQDYEKKGRKEVNNYLRFSGLAFQMLAVIGGFTYLGYRIDGWQEHRIPVWTLVLSLLSIGAALYHFIRTVAR